MGGLEKIFLSHGIRLRRSRNCCEARAVLREPGSPSVVMTWIRREFHCFPSKAAENPAFVSKMLHQSLDFHKRSFSPPGVLIYESDEVSHPPTFG